VLAGRFHHRRRSFIPCSKRAMRDPSPSGASDLRNLTTSLQEEREQRITGAGGARTVPRATCAACSKESPGHDKVTLQVQARQRVEAPLRP